MFGIDSPELLVIAVVALIVIGPKELPGMLRSWGRWMAQMRGMAAEFRGHVDEMVRQSELDEVKKQLESTPGLDLQALDPTKQIKSGRGQGPNRQSPGRAGIRPADRRRSGPCRRCRNSASCPRRAHSCSGREAGEGRCCRLRTN